MLPVFLQAQYTEVINSNRPSRSMGAFSVGTNVYQWEQGLSMQNGTFSTFQDAQFSGIGSRSQLRIGLFKEQLEFIGTMDYQNDTFSYTNWLGSQEINRTGYKEVSVGMKYLIFDPFRNEDMYIPNIISWRKNNRFRWQDLIPVVAVYATADFSLGDTYPYQETFAPLFRYYYKPISAPPITATAMLLLQQHIFPGWVLVHNAGMHYITTDFPAKKLIGTLTYSFRDRWSFYGEYQLDDSLLYSDLTLGTGAAYLLNKNMQLDVAIQTSVKKTPHLFSAGIGFSFRFDKHKIYADSPQSNTDIKLARSERKSIKKTDKRMGKGLRKLDKKQKRIERKINRKR